MKLIIDISKESYKALCNGCMLPPDVDNVVQGIKNGTPLPKGHGRLGDLDALEKLCIEHNIANSAYDNSPMIEQSHYSDGDCIWKPLFDFAPTIIESDKVENEE